MKQKLFSSFNKLFSALVSIYILGCSVDLAKKYNFEFFYAAVLIRVSSLSTAVSCSISSTAANSLASLSRAT